ncbi:hypothetical protein PO590_13640 [Raoultella ornithinolytica]|uniref:hypothetical protein n=1 Tax=Raoultella ornithinolytica TaxID=54291 RepID=UPI002FFBE498
MIHLQTQLDAIRERIAEAKDIVTRRERSVKRAERNLEIAEDNLAELQNERDELLIASWGDKPNWQVIFDLVDPSPAMYEYKEKWVREKGLHSTGMYNCHTNQGAFSVGFTTTSVHELNQNIRMVEFVMQYLRADRKNEKTMIVYNVPTDNCCYNFVFNTGTGKYGITTDSFMCRSSISEFSTAEEALRYLQSISDTDIVPESESLPGSGISEKE